MHLFKTASFLLIVISSTKGFSQINSPYSRFGMGDLYNSRNAAHKAMGNLATPVADMYAVNFINPASYSRLQTVTFDVGLEYESRTLRSATKPETYKSGNLTFNYVALGLPLKRDKQGFTTWGLAFGLRPISRINYKIEENTRLQGIDSSSTLYEGSGGANKAFIGTGIRIKGLSVGVNAGYYFGQQDISNQRSFINDSVAYFQANYQSNTSYNKFFAEAGLSYDIKLSKTSLVRLAATGNLGQTIKASRDLRRETIVYNASGSFDSLDVIQRENGVRGEIKLPVGYTIGLLYEKTGRFMIGAEYEKVNWDDYSFYGQKDQVANTGVFRMGAQYSPKQKVKGYFNKVTYRAGFYTGNDYIKTNAGQLNVWAVSFGLGLPVRRWNNYTNQWTAINTSFEIGKRAGNQQPVTESFFKLNVGLCLSDIWFNKRKFD